MPSPDTLGTLLSLFTKGSPSHSGGSRFSGFLVAKRTAFLMASTTVKGGAEEESTSMAEEAAARDFSFICSKAIENRPESHFPKRFPSPTSKNSQPSFSWKPSGEEPQRSKISGRVGIGQGYGKVLGSPEEELCSSKARRAVSESKGDPLRTNVTIPKWSGGDSKPRVFHR